MRKPPRRMALKRKPRKAMMPDVSSPPPSMTASVTSVRLTAATPRRRKERRVPTMPKSNWPNSLNNLLSVTKFLTMLMPTATQCTLV